MSGRGSRPAGAATIGERNERSLHRALKARYAGAAGATERAVDGFVADMVTGDRIVEVHTGGFGPLRRKLRRLLDMAQRRWRRLSGSHLLPLVRAGVRFVDGLPQARGGTEGEARKEAA